LVNHGLLLVNHGLVFGNIGDCEERNGVTPFRKGILFKKDFYRSYSCSNTDGSERFPLSLYELYKSRRLSESSKIPYPKLILSALSFLETVPLIEGYEFLRFCVILLLERDVYPALGVSCPCYAKANIIFILQKKDSKETIAKPLAKKAIPLTLEDGTPIPKGDIANHISNIIELLLEMYDGFVVNEIIIRAYFEKDLPSALPIVSEDDLLSAICDYPYSSEYISEIDVSTLVPKVLRSTKRGYSRHMPRSKRPAPDALSSFLVADTETLLIEDVHTPYAIGVMLVCGGREFWGSHLNTFYSEDFSSLLYPSFEERSIAMLQAFIFRVHNLVKNNRKLKLKTIYFHNFARFDGFFILKHLVLHHTSYKVKPLIRNNMIYEITVYSSKNKLLFRFRDSHLLLPGSLASLAQNLCPDLGSKGEVNHADVRLETLRDMKERERLLNYMRQDIRLLGGIMHKFQLIYYEKHNDDIVKNITAPSLALTLFRKKYYDEEKGGIHIPNQNEDSFIRRGYYGGHSDAYIPKGENLYYYDVNSLYPFIMSESLMPGGVPVWHSNLESMELDTMFGFIEAYVECPKTIKRPFLPYRDKKSGTLIFPTGTFIGVYYSEELKYARDIGYTVIPINGYLFDKMESPFKGYVNDLFESRSKAKKDGQNDLSYIYKLLMNSLYGRFGIDPESSITEICDLSRRNILFKGDSFINEVNIKEDLYMVTYLRNVVGGEGYTSWSPPRFSAVQIAAAITACARIYMYPFISREDCYYTDTDSVVLGSPLPDEEISPTLLGKLKLEDKILKAFFLAPKVYWYSTIDEKNVIKYKGAGKEHVDAEWFERQYLDPSQSQIKEVTSYFRRDWQNIDIKKKVSTTTLRTISGKRTSIIDENGIWVGSDPIHINDLSSINKIGRDVISNFKRKLKDLENEKQKRISSLTRKNSEP